MTTHSRSIQNKVLLLDGEEFSTLAILRSLGQKDLQVTVAASDPKAICQYSKYIHRFFNYPNPLSNLDGFYKSIQKELSENQYSLIIPVTELTSLPLSKIRQEIEKHAVLAIADNDSLELVTDKAKTFTLAQQLNVPIPKSYNIINQQSLKNCSDELNYPVVIKPSRSIIDPKDDIRAKLKVDYAFDKEELLKIVVPLLKNTKIILQEYCQGTGTGIELIADQGEIIHAFQHQRIHELPLTGGGSCLRKSIPVNQELLAYSKQLIKALNWHGVAMVEFKHNPVTNQACLMEINGRFWGSLPLAFSSGSDFPWYLYQLLVKQQYPDKFYSEAGHTSRKLEQDLYWYMQVIFRRDNSPLISWPSNNQIFKDFISIFHYKHHFDAFTYKDLKPGFIELARTAKWFLSFVSSFILKKLLYKKHLKIKKIGGAKKILTKANNILFVCYGNINRSAIAEHILKQSNHSHSIQSTGFHPKDNRPADPNMIKVAKENQIDLSQHLSSKITKEMIEQSDIIFTMEIDHISKLLEQYPKVKNKTYLLSSLTMDQNIPLEISDPYGKTINEYEKCFKEIEQCINSLTTDY